MASGPSCVSSIRKAASAVASSRRKSNLRFAAQKRPSDRPDMMGVPSQEHPEVGTLTCLCVCGTGLTLQALCLSWRWGWMLQPLSAAMFSKAHDPSLQPDLHIMHAYWNPVNASPPLWTASNSWKKQKLAHVPEWFPANAGAQCAVRTPASSSQTKLQLLSRAVTTSG